MKAYDAFKRMLTENICNLRVENYVLLGGNVKTSSSRGRLSRDSKRTGPRKRGGGRGARLCRCLLTKSRWSKLQKFFLFLNKLKKIRYCKLRNLVLFYVWEDARVRVHWNPSFLWYAPQPSGAWVFTSWVSSGLTWEVTAVWCLLHGRCSLPPVFS